MTSRKRSPADPPPQTSTTGLITIVGLYFAVVAVLVAILALTNLNWDTETLSKMMLGLLVLVGGIGVALVYDLSKR